MGSKIHYAIYGLDGTDLICLDILTFIFLYFIIVPLVTGYHYVHGSESALQFIILFQTGWFIESMWSQTMVIHMLRTAKVPFVQSRPAWLVILTTLVAAFFVTSLPYGPLVNILRLAPLGLPYFLFLICIISCICLALQLLRNFTLRSIKNGYSSVFVKKKE